MQLDARSLRQMGLATWMTDAGPVDFLDGLRNHAGHLVPYEQLAQRAVVVQEGGRRVRIAALENIIAAKAEEEVKRLRKRVGELEKEREILKRATVFWMKESNE